uniref:Legumin-like storage protein n=1 Tax=Pseudotsuga menziesii TaxID=3357 RepID=Q40933_PSEMZ|nr:legumin-like storage protein [Pseudotsuga menziesii]
MERRMRLGSALLVLYFSFLVISVSSVTDAQRRSGSRYGGEDERSSRPCRRLQRLRAHEPSESESIRSEGGTFEFSSGEDNEELECAGVAFIRKTIESNAIAIPQYPSAPELVYVARGEGRVGIVFPGCPETFREDSSFRGRSCRRSEGRREEEDKEEDSSQKVRRVRRGDVIAIFAGAAHWWYNDGNEPLQLIAIAHTASPHNQLGRRSYRPFSLAGPASGSSSRSPREEGEGERRDIGGNILAGFSTRSLAETLGVELETARKLQQNQRSRLFARVEQGRRLSLPGPARSGQRDNEMMQQLHETHNSFANENENDVEEVVCALRVKHNADNPEDADIYVRDGGRMNIVNRFKLPVLKYLGLGAERVILRQRASTAPSWRMNAHGIMYVTRGEGRIEVVGEQGRSLFDGRVREGQFIVIPQFHAVIKQAGDDGLEWITFTTSDASVRSSLAGRESVLKAMPEDVVSAAYRMDRNEVREVMRNREDDTLILPPSPRHQRDIESRVQVE